MRQQPSTIGLHLVQLNLQRFIGSEGPKHDSRM